MHAAVGPATLVEPETVAVVGEVAVGRAEAAARGNLHLEMVIRLVGCHGIVENRFSIKLSKVKLC